MDASEWSTSRTPFDDCLPAQDVLVCLYSFDVPISPCMLSLPWYAPACVSITHHPFMHSRRQKRLTSCEGGEPVEADDDAAAMSSCCCFACPCCCCAALDTEVCGCPASQSVAARAGCNAAHERAADEQQRNNSSRQAGRAARRGDASATHYIHALFAVHVLFLSPPLPSPSSCFSVTCVDIQVLLLLSSRWRENP